VYHIELRQFPHNMCRFNLGERELRAVVEPWMREPWVELGERKWSPHQAKLTILEGPQIPLEQLTMGRGWRAAQRRSQDVTEPVLAAAKQAPAPPPDHEVEGSRPDGALVADSLALELLALLGDGPAPLAQAWRLAAARFPDAPPGECLKLAEHSVRSLLAGRLIVLLRAPSTDAHQHDDQHKDGAEVGESELEALLGALDSWSDLRDPASVRMRRA
jgi:hypothetical protein